MQTAVRAKHWDSLSDDELVDLQMEVDDPNTLPGLVNYVPDGDEEPHVEFKYDLRKSEREAFACVHGNHRHLAGFVFRKGNVRFLVGHICGKNIYGADFERYTADYHSAVNRRNTLVRLRDLRAAVSSFTKWLDDDAWAGALTGYTDLRIALHSKMPFVFETLQDYANSKLYDAQMPRFLCLEYRWYDEGSRSVDAEFERLRAEVSAVGSILYGPKNHAERSVGAIIERLQRIIRRTGIILAKLADVELFFQPATLAAICRHADNAVPFRARHYAGLMKLSTKKHAVEMPPGFRIPSRGPLQLLEKAISS